jgi:hypothetical protein
VIRPGQIYWNTQTGVRAVVYSVRPEVVRLVMVTRRGRHTAPRSVVWKHGVARHYKLWYEPRRAAE